MQLPIVNTLTGTNREDLLNDYLTAKKAMLDAVSAMSGIWPNARDYQGGDINAAMREHAARCASIRQVIAEIDVIAESLV